MAIGPRSRALSSSTRFPDLKGMRSFACRARQHPSGLGGRCSLGGHLRKRCQARVAASLASHHTVRSCAHRTTSCRTKFPPLPTRPQCDVTLALQACNAKKNFSRKSSFEPTDICACGCNAGQTAPIFWQNSSVSYAVEGPIDCVMLNRNSPLYFPSRPGFTGVVARVSARSLSILRPRTVERGAS